MKLKFLTNSNFLVNFFIKRGEIVDLVLAKKKSLFIKISLTKIHSALHHISEIESFAKPPLYIALTFNSIMSYVFLFKFYICPHNRNVKVKYQLPS